MHFYFKIVSLLNVLSTTFTNAAPPTSSLSRTVEESPEIDSKVVPEVSSADPSSSILLSSINLGTLTTFLIEQGPTEMWNAVVDGKTYFIKNAIKYPYGKPVGYNPRINNCQSTDTELVLSEIMYSKVYQDVFDVGSIQHQLIINDLPTASPTAPTLETETSSAPASPALGIDLATFPRYLLGSFEIKHHPLSSFRSPSLVNGFLVDTFVLNDDVGFSVNFMQLDEDSVIRSDSGGAGPFYGWGNRKAKWEISPSEGGQIEFMLLGQPKYLSSEYFTSLEASDFEAMWDKFSLPQNTFDERISELNAGMKIIVDAMNKEDQDLANYFLENEFAVLKSRFEYMIANKASIKEEFEKSLTEFKRRSELKRIGKLVREKTMVGDWNTCILGLDSCSSSSFVCCVAPADVESGKATCRPPSDCAVGFQQSERFNNGK